MARGVDDIDFEVFKMNGGVFGKDRDAALFFLVVGVHHPFGDLLVVAEDVGLLEKAIEQGGFAMVDVGDDGNIANFFWLVHILLLVKKLISEAVAKLAASEKSMILASLARTGFAGSCGGGSDILG